MPEGDYDNVRDIDAEWVKLFELICDNIDARCSVYQVRWRSLGSSCKGIFVDIFFDVPWELRPRFSSWMTRDRVRCLDVWIS
jgi:hypothetical protein